MSGWYPHVRGHRTMHHMMHPDEPVLLRTLRHDGYCVWWGGKNDLVPAGADSAGVYCDVRYDPASSFSPIRPLWATDREDQWRGIPGSKTYYSFYVGRLDRGAEREYFDRDWADVMGAIACIKQWSRSGQAAEQPLCIYLALTYPHPPYAVEDPWFGMTDRSHMPRRIQAPDPEKAKLKPRLLSGIRERQGLEDWDESRWDELRAVYYGMCTRVDHQFGLVVDALKAADMYDDTLIVFFSDHGDFAGDYGLVEKTQNTFEDCLTRVPLVIKPPASVAVDPGIRDALVELVDLPATVEAVAEITPQHEHFGRTLVPLIEGSVKTHRDAVFCEGGRLPDERQAMELESPSSHDRAGLYWPRLSLQADTGPAHLKATMCRTEKYKYVRRLGEYDELYDLENDPTEEKNVVNEPGYSSILASMSDRLLTWYQASCDVVPLTPDRRG